MAQPSCREGTWSTHHTASLMARSMFYYIQSAGHFKCAPDYVTDRKDYNTMLLAYTLKGKGYLRYRGASYTLAQGQGFLINCIDHHYYATDPNDLWEFKWIHFNGCESQSYVERVYSNCGPAFSLSKESIIPYNTELIHKMLMERDRRIDIIGSCKIVEMLTELLLGSCNGREDKESMPQAVMTAVREMERNFYKKMDLDVLANRVGISKYHLSRLFKKYTGYSPYEYVLNYRLSQAKNLLKSTEYSVYEIARRVGFDSPSHFIKLFRQHEGTTPLKFREYWR